MFAVLRQRDFALLWFGQLISSLGSWILWIALPFFVYEQTGSALATGAMFVILTLPPILFGSLAGVFVDRWDRKRTMFIAEIARAFVTLAMLFAIIPGLLWILYPIAFIDATIEQFFKPAKNAVMPSLVGKEDLLAANRLTSLSGDLSMLIGPALGGLLVGVIGIANVVLLDALSFLVSGLMIYWITASLLDEQAPLDPAGEVRQTAIERAWREWVAGLRLVRSNRLLLSIFCVMGVAMLGQGIISIAWVVFVKKNLGGGPFEYGIVQVAVAAGGIVGAFVLGRAGHLWRQSALIAICGMLTGIFLLTTFHLPHLPIILGLQFLGGIASVGFFVTMETLLQSTVSTDYLGRVFGAFGTTSVLLLLCGQGLAAALTDRLDTVRLLDGAAGFYFLSGVVALLLMTRAEDKPTGRLCEIVAESQN